ncbi:MAG: LytR C-terminal domain-containing protein [Actinomycetota bacterium]|nr:LytR C-terminal domain-containing protein [Actinomycetota bacterium]
MGRHSSSDQAPFYRSFIGWIAVWVAIAVITVGAVWVIVKAIGGPETTPNTLAGAEGPSPEPTVAEDPSTIAATPSPRATPTTAEDVQLITDGITVQVLNGTAQPKAAPTMADRLTGLGYTVVAVEESSRAYPETTVFWSADDFRDAAEALAARFGWDAAPKPGNLSPEVALHVVVGADEA